jgi:hypothetical protein
MSLNESIPQLSDFQAANESVNECQQWIENCRFWANMISDPTEQGYAWLDCNALIYSYGVCMAEISSAPACWLNCTDQCNASATDFQSYMDCEWASVCGYNNCYLGQPAQPAAENSAMPAAAANNNAMPAAAANNNAMPAAANNNAMPASASAPAPAPAPAAANPGSRRFLRI